MVAKVEVMVEVEAVEVEVMVEVEVLHMVSCLRPNFLDLHCDFGF